MVRCQTKEWKNVRFKNGIIENNQNGRMTAAKWKDGRMAEWQNGRMKR
jgi:hypothetical protein